MKVSAGAKPVALVTEEMGPLRAGDLITAVDGRPVDRKLLADGLMPKKARTTVLTLVRGEDDRDDARRRASRRARDVIATGIQKIDDTHYTIEKTAVERVARKPDHGRARRALRAVDEGRQDRRLELYAIRPQSVFASLGLMERRHAQRDQRPRSHEPRQGPRGIQ